MSGNSSNSEDVAEENETLHQEIKQLTVALGIEAPLTSNQYIPLTTL